jgi:hypothetical protein
VVRVLDVKLAARPALPEHPHGGGARRDDWRDRLRRRAHLGNDGAPDRPPPRPILGHVEGDVLKRPRGVVARRPVTFGAVSRVAALAGREHDRLVRSAFA